MSKIKNDNWPKNGIIVKDSRGTNYCLNPENGGIRSINMDSDNLESVNYIEVSDVYAKEDKIYIHEIYFDEELNSYLTYEHVYNATLADAKENADMHKNTSNESERKSYMANVAKNDAKWLSDKIDI